MMEVGQTDEPVWQPEELGQILRHQLDTPLDSDLPARTDGSGGGTQSSTQEAGPPIKTFADLLVHPAPPAQQLSLVKDFAKRNRADAAPSLPAEVATVLYYAAIGAALLRCGERITGLSDDALREGLEWSLSRPWIDERLRLVAQESLGLLDT